MDHTSSSTKLPMTWMIGSNSRLNGKQGIKQIKWKLQLEVTICYLDLLEASDLTSEFSEWKCYMISIDEFFMYDPFIESDFCDSMFLFISCLKVKGQISRSSRKFGKPVLPNAISPTDFITSIITAFCDSFGRYPLVHYWQMAQLSDVSWPDVMGFFHSVLENKHSK